MMITKTDSLSVLIKKADDVFSDYVRLRVAISGGISRCFICRAPRLWKYQQCGHYMNRAYMPTRYSTTNCQCVCESCNSFDNKHHERFKEALIKFYGPSIPDSLELKARGLQKFTRVELIDLIDDFKSKVKILKSNL
jgi:hypothetical protein